MAGPNRVRPHRVDHHHSGQAGLCVCGYLSEASLCSIWPKPCCFLQPMLTFTDSIIMAIRSGAGAAKLCYNWPKPSCAGAGRSLAMLGLPNPPVQLSTPGVAREDVHSELVGESFLSTNRLTLLLHSLPHRASGASVGSHCSWLRKPR